MIKSLRSNWLFLSHLSIIYPPYFPKTFCFGLSFLLCVSAFAQEGTKQLIPTSLDRLYIELYGDSSNFAGYTSPERERLHIALNQGEKIHFGMQMSEFRGDASLTSFRIKDPDGNIVFPQTPFPQDTNDLGFIETYEQAVTGPQGVLDNGSPITDGYPPFVYTAQMDGDHYIEFETWSDSTFTVRDPVSSWIAFFDMTVTDASDNIVKNPSNQPSGRLWSKQWSLTTTNFNQFAVQADFFIYTDNGFVNKVNYEMLPFGFVFVSNTFGVKRTADAFENRQSLAGNAFINDVSEHRIFLNDPDQALFPSSTIQPIIRIWFNNTLVFDYDFQRSPALLDLNPGVITARLNEADSCPHESSALFRIESNLTGQLEILLDIDGNGFDNAGTDRSLFVDLVEGTTYLPWNLRDRQGIIHPTGTFNGEIIVLLAGITHFPLYDVERLRGVSTEAIRPFPSIGPTLFWDDRALNMPPASLTVSPGSDSVQLSFSTTLERIWDYNEDRFDQNNGNLNTVNSWFSGLDLNADFQYQVVQTNVCVNNDHDQDEKFDVLDIDDDNDGLPDLVECPESVDPSVDEDNDGILNYLDADLPGFQDENGDGVNDNFDRDRDGIPDFFDLDSDNDGISDVVEAFGGDPEQIDPDSNGIIGLIEITDSDLDGLEDSVDPEIFGSTPGIPLLNPDTDGDNLTNAEDLDSDSDGIPDNREGQSTPGYIAPLVGVDSDVDGLNDAYDQFFNQYNEAPPYGSFGDPIAGGASLFPVNTDTQDEVDYREADSDNDTVVDWIEGFDDDEDGFSLADLTLRAQNYETTNGNPGHYPSTDSDANGQPDWLDDADQDQVPNFLDPQATGFYRDTDQDGLVDLYDETNGGTGYGLALGTFAEPDNDGDNAPNYRDVDSQPCLRTPLTTFQGDTAVCIGGDLALIADEIGATSYTWRQDGNVVSTERTLTLENVDGSIEASAFTLEVLAGSCQTISAPFSVTVSPAPDLTFSGDTQICVGDTLRLTANEASANTYRWLQDGVEIAIGRTLTINGIDSIQAAGDFVLEIDNGACVIQSETFNLTLAAPPDLTFSGLTSVCTGDTLILVANEAGANAYRWLRGGVEIATGQTLTINNIDPSASGNDYALEVNANCRATSANFSITVNERPNLDLILSLDDEELCEDDPTTIIRIANSEAGAFYQLQIAGNNQGDPVQGNGATLEIPTGPILSTGLLTIRVLVSRPPCTPELLTQFLSVNISALPQVDLALSALEPDLCLGNNGTDIILENSETDVSYQLLAEDTIVGSALLGNGGQLTFPTGPISELGTVLFQVQAFKQNCAPLMLNQEVAVTLNDSLSPTVTIASSLSGGQICAGGTATFIATATADGDNPTYQWLLNGETIAGQNNDTLAVAGLQDGDLLQAVLLSSLPCTNPTASNELVINTLPAPVVDIQADQTQGIAGCRLILRAEGAETYTWEPASQIVDISPSGDQVEIQPQASGIFTVTGTNEQGCIGQDTVQITIVDEQDLFIPSLFSPNGDGRNDRFVIHGNCIEDVTLQVFDRAGNLVYEALTLQEATEVGWDGTHNGEKQPIGKYIWRISGTATDGQDLRFQGSDTGKINLFR